jgi:lysyl-tRNA synthetase class 2
LFNDKYIAQRLEKAEKLRELGYNPYDNKIDDKITISEFISKNEDVKEKENQRDEDRKFCVTGRIKFIRWMGKAAFLKIEDDSGMLQIYIARDNLPEDYYNKVLKKTLEVGDIIYTCGYPFVTKTGELSLHASSLKILTKAVAPLPEKYHGLTDIEARYRQRYLDMIMNKEVKDVMKTRSKIVSLVRRFFEDKGFLEVETPMLHTVVGGANAKPFFTHHNALDIDMNLRIAPELYLKRLIVGGFEAVFEINRNFRNEGIDHTHNPEFTMIEFYWAYKTYEDLINITKELFKYLLDNLGLDSKVKFGDLEIDFNDVKVIPYKDALITLGGVPEDILDNVDKMKAYLKEKAGVEVEKHIDSVGKLWGELFDEFVEEKLINPTFVTEFPIDISPLARRNDEYPELADRFELFIAGREIANGFSELNDPVDQYERFKRQIENKALGDDEATEMDEDYIKALSYGMAPTAGQGIGIDRLVMLLTNQHSIKDVILFPTMKPLKKSQTEETTEEK